VTVQLVGGNGSATELGSGRVTPAVGSSARRDLPGRLELNPLAAERAEHVTAHDDLVSDDPTGHPGLVTDDDVLGVDIALNLALDRHLALRHEVAEHREVRSDDRLNAAITRRTERPSGTHG
jgi:hypothetical protein